MPFCNLLFYMQRCDVNQPLHPLVRAIPTLGEASGSGPGHWFLFQSFPEGWLGKAAAERSKRPWGGCLAAAPCSALPASHRSHCHPCQHLGLCILRLCTQFFKIQPQKIFPCETSQADPHETLALNFQSPESLAALPPGHCSC